MAAFSSASATALLRASTLVITPSTNYEVYFILNIYFTINARNACAYLVYPSTAFSIGQVLLWPALDFDSVRRSPQYERQQSPQVLLETEEKSMSFNESSCDHQFDPLSGSFFHRTVYQGLLSIL